MSRLFEKLRYFKYIYINKYWVVLKNLYRLLAFSAKNQSRLIVVLSLTEHIGDIVACEPVAHYLKQQDPGIYLFWVVTEKYKELLIENPNVDQVLTVNYLGEWIILKKLINKKIRVIDLHLDGKPCPLNKLELKNPNAKNIDIHNYYHYGNLLKTFSQSAGLEISDDVTPVLHFNFDHSNNLNLPEKFIVLHTSGNDFLRDWKAENWNALVSDVLNNNPDIYIIEIGLKGVISKQSERFLDFCGKLTLKENALVISKAFFFIGIDSAFAHFANACKIKSLILLGNYRNFERYMPYSGFFKDNKDKYIFYYDGDLRELPVKPVFEQLSNIWSNKNA